MSSAYSAVSQFTFDIAAKNALYAANSTLYTKGADPLLPQNDNVFSDGYALQIATLTRNETTGAYEAYFEAVIQGSGTTTGYLEKETAKYMALGQNYPNPCSGMTTIPLTLKSPARVRLSLWNLAGQKIWELDGGTLNTGEHLFPIDFSALNLPMASYAYQVEIENGQGIYKDCKMITVLR